LKKETLCHSFTALKFNRASDMPAAG